LWSTTPLMAPSTGGTHIRYIGRLHALHSMGVTLLLKASAHAVTRSRQQLCSYVHALDRRTTLTQNVIYA
jgi:hypothetical protein